MSPGLLIVVSGPAGRQRYCCKKITDGTGILYFLYQPHPEHQDRVRLMVKIIILYQEKIRRYDKE